MGYVGVSPIHCAIIHKKRSARPQLWCRVQGILADVEQSQLTAKVSTTTEPIDLGGGRGQHGSYPG